MTKTVTWTAAEILGEHRDAPGVEHVRQQQADALAAMLDGQTMHQSATAAGVSMACLCDWLRHDPVMLDTWARLRELYPGMSPGPYLAGGLPRW